MKAHTIIIAITLFIFGALALSGCADDGLGNNDLGPTGGNPDLDTDSDTDGDTDSDSDSDTDSDSDSDSDGDIDTSLPVDEPFYFDKMNIQFYSVSPDGKYVGGMNFDDDSIFIVAVEDIVDSPTDASLYIELTDENQPNIAGSGQRQMVFSGDNNLIAANIKSTYVDGEVAMEMSAAAYYNRTDKTWTWLPDLRDPADFGYCNFFPAVRDMTPDGKTIVGRTPTKDKRCHFMPFLFDIASEAYTVLDDVDGLAIQSGGVEGVSADGKTAVGYAKVDNSILPVFWKEGTDGTFEGTFLRSSVQIDGGSMNITGDGAIISGHVDNVAYTWDISGETIIETRLGSLSQMDAEPHGISDDGKTVVGYHVMGNAHGQPFIWQEGQQIDFLKDYLNDEGISDLGNWNESTFGTSDISPSGKVIVGWAWGLGWGWGGWLAIIP